MFLPTRGCLQEQPGLRTRRDPIGALHLESTKKELEYVR